MHTYADQCVYALVYTTPSNRPSDFAAIEVASDLARRFNMKAHAVIVGTCNDPAINHAKSNGIESIFVLTPDPSCGNLQTHQVTDFFVHAVSEIGLIREDKRSIFLVSSGSECEEMAGQLAARIQASPLGKAVDLRLDDAGRLMMDRIAFSGRLIFTFVAPDRPCIISVRSGSNRSVTIDRQNNVTFMKELSNVVMPRPSFQVSSFPREEKHASLEGANLVIAGGRGMGGEEGFASLYQLADKIGGAVGSSLPAVDAGWAPVSRQVGQSGKYVAPAVYLAIGISGTPQHLAGIDPHTQIIAINNDPDANIFKIANIGVIAQWQELLPPLFEALNRQGP